MSRVKWLNRGLILIVALLLTKSFADSGKIYPLQMSWVSNLFAEIRVNLGRQATISPSILDSELLKSLQENPLGAGDSDPETSLMVDLIAIQPNDIGCTETFNQYARGDVAIDGRGGLVAKIQSISQAGFKISVQERDGLRFLVAEGAGGSSQDLGEVYCLRFSNNERQAIIISEHDNASHVSLILDSDNVYVGEFKIHYASRET